MFSQVRLLEQQNQQLSLSALPPPPRSPRRKKLDSTDSADSTASSSSINGGERSNGRVGGRSGAGRGVRPPVPVLTLPLPTSGQVGRNLPRPSFTKAHDIIKHSPDDRSMASAVHLGTLQVAFCDSQVGPPTFSRFIWYLVLSSNFDTFHSVMAESLNFPVVLIKEGRNLKRGTR